MTAFIELPRLDVTGREITSSFINTNEIVSFRQAEHGQVDVQVNHGANMLKIVTYLPLEQLIVALNKTAMAGFVITWRDDQKAEWAAPVRAAIKGARQFERP